MGGHMFASPWSHIVDVGSNYLGQHPTNDDSRHWFLETVLCNKCSIERHWRTPTRLEPCRLLLRSMGRRCASSMQGSRRKRVLGCLLLWRWGTVNFPNSVDRVVHTDCFHMGRFCVHVHRSFAGHTTPCEA